MIHTRWRNAGVVVFLVIGMGAMVFMVSLLRGKTGCETTANSLFQTIGLSLDATARTMTELERASDVVVRREASGSLTVYGRAVRQRLSLSSANELKAFLRTLPAPRVGMVVVASAHRVIDGALTHPSDPELQSAERALITTLAEAGFTQPRGSLKTFLPLECGDDRPARR